MSDTLFAEMISRISHELRSPLTSLKGFSSTLVSRWDRFTDEQRFQLIEMIHADSERMVRVVSEVLDLARIEAGQLEIHKQEVPISGLIDQATERVASLPGAERLESKVATDLVASVDRDRLLDVLTNLIENAIRFSDAGAVSISAATEGSDVLILVSDRGAGVPSEMTQAIFSGLGPRSDKATPRGTGLGLYLAKRVIELHGGDIEVSSTEGEGSTFTIRIPAGRSDG